MPYAGCIRYKDVDGCVREYSWIHNVADIAKLQQFCTDVAPLLGANADKIGVTETAYIAIPGVAVGEITQSLQVTLKDPTTGARHGFMLPAPSKDLFERTASGKYRLVNTIGVQLAQFYFNLTGIPVEFVSGALVGPIPSA